MYLPAADSCSTSSPCFYKKGSRKKTLQKKGLAEKSFARKVSPSRETFTNIFLKAAARMPKIAKLIGSPDCLYNSLSIRTFGNFGNSFR